MTGPGKKIAIVLCGCGRADGSEIHESVSFLVHFSRLGLAYDVFAPDMPQTEVINHATGKPMPAGSSRNQMVEAARISRGNIRPITHLHAAEYAGVAFPGGFGAAKNLCDFASKGAQCAVLPDVERVIREFHGSGKPIALCCIAPVLVARVLGTRQDGPGVKVTIGTDAATGEAIATMGSQNIAKGVTEAFVDERHKIVTTPAYMLDATPWEVFQGIGAMAEAFAKLLK
jgi:enhancing lycopene biosynthesis protein 2